MAVLTRVSSPALIGRGEELTELRRVLGEVLAGGSACAVVAGEAGLGKTRLVRELLGGAGDVELLTGGCVEVGSDVLPYAPFVDVLSDLAAREGAAAVRALGGATGNELARLLPDVGDPPDVTAASTSRLYSALRSLLSGLAARRPLLLLVEDLHWSDRATRDLLALLAHRLPPRTLLLLTARTDEADEEHAVPRFLARLAAAGAHRVELRPFTRAEQALQLSGIVGVPPTRARLDQVYARAEGNPFFAEELIALGAADVVPVTVRDLLEARVQALPPETRRVVRAAAAAGRRVEHALLARAVDLGDAALDDALRHALDRHVLVTDGRVYVFRHALLHETVAASLLPGERARVHRRLAEALAAAPSLAESRHGLAGRITHHWLAAGDEARGRRASFAAAREAARTLAFAEALTHYERVIALPGDDEDLPVPRYRLLWDAAEVAHLVGAARRAADLVQQAIGCVDPAERHHHAYLHERLGRYLWMAAEGEHALAAYRRAVDLVPEDPVTHWQAAIISGYSQVLMLSGRFDEARAQAELAIDLARQVPDGRATEGHARNNLGVALAHLGEVDRGIEELRAAARIAREGSDVDDVARAVVNLAAVLFDTGRFPESLAVALGGIATVEQLGLQRRKGIWCRCDAVDSLLVLGRSDEAEDLLREAFALHPEGIDAVRAHSMRGALALRRGRLDEARSELLRARRLGRHVVDGHLVLPVVRALLETLRWRGEWPAALDLVAEVRRQTWSDGDAAYLVPVLAAAAGAAADGAIAGQRAHRTAEERRWCAVAGELVAAAEGATQRPEFLLAPATAALAVARAELSRATGQDGAGAWSDAAGAWQDLGDVYQAGCARLREAECLLADRRRAAAAVALRAAHGAAIAARARHLLRAVQTTAARARLPLEDRPTDVGRPFGLSARESDVLALVVRGRTDRQIGAELFISHRTVERHVSNILAKLDAHTRAEIVAIAHRHELVAPEPRRPVRSGQTPATMR